MTSTDDGEISRGIQENSGDIGFKPGEMSACGSCGRANAPNRARCMYCDAAMELRAGSIGPRGLQTRIPEPDENAYNLVLVRGSDGFDTVAAARLLGRDPEVLEAAARGGVPVPIARFAAENEINIIAERMMEIGGVIRTVRDEELRAEVPPRRLRAMRFGTETVELFDFNTNERAEYGWEDLLLVVGGSIVESRTEASGKRKGQSMKVTDTLEMTADTAVLDLYFSDDLAGCRIMTHGFDFSCLGAKKGMLAAENIGKLTAELKIAATGARFVEAYGSLKNVISEIWPPEARREAGELKRSYGRLGIETVSVTSNRTQFAKFSRLQRHLL